MIPVRAFLMNALSHTAQRQTLADSRLRKHADFMRAYAAGHKRKSETMSWFLAPQTRDAEGAPHPGRVGLTVGKALGMAHQRNHIKRRMREALRRHVDLLPRGFDLIFHPRSTVATIGFAKLEAEIVRILEIAGAEAARCARSPAVSPQPPARPAS